MWALSNSLKHWNWKQLTQNSTNWEDHVSVLTFIFQDWHQWWSMIFEYFVCYTFPWTKQLLFNLQNEAQFYGDSLFLKFWMLKEKHCNLVITTNDCTFHKINALLFFDVNSFHFSLKNNTLTRKGIYTLLVEIG